MLRPQNVRVKPGLGKDDGVAEPQQGAIQVHSNRGLPKTSQKPNKIKGPLCCDRIFWSWLSWVLFSGSLVASQLEVWVSFTSWGELLGQESVDTAELKKAPNQPT